MGKIDLKIYPLGGVAEIGSNMTIFETEHHMIVIDYGILFPYEDFFDINYLIVDTESIRKTTKELILFITHGHEDHIGATYHFLQDFPQAKVYAPRFARQLILEKLAQKDFSFEITEYEESFRFKFDEFELTPVHVTHSIPDTFGVIVKKQKEMGILFISDFKYDLNPSFESPFNTQKIKNEISSCETRLAFLDSTNILNPDKTVSESELVDTFRSLFKRKQRTFITMFASNIYRLKNILECAKAEGRTVSLIGRSLGFYLQAAHDVGILNLEDYPIKVFDGIQNYNDPNNIFLVTGSQGEHLGATRRIAAGEQKHITLNEQDLFIFSSKAIPGNEKKIYRLYNQIAGYGTEIISSREMKVHASGHPGQEDLKALVNEIQPTDIIPIHGEIFFLNKHIDFIKQNFTDITPHYMTNFDTLLWKNKQLSIIDHMATDPIIIHGNSLPIPRDRISERRKIACNGLIVIAINHKNKNINIDYRGLPDEIKAYNAEIKDLAHYTTFQEFKNRDYDYVTDQVRIKTRRIANKILGYKPITIVQMV